MSQSTNPVAPSTGPSLSRLACCAPLPLLQSENAADYDDLLARVSGHLKPSDILEDIWVREIVDLLWENLRWRRDLARCLDTALPKVLEEIIQPLMLDQAPTTPRGTSFMSRINAACEAHTAHHDLVRRWTQRDPDAIKRINELLASVKLSIDHVQSQVAVRELAKIERFNCLIASTAWRRDALLREIERHRDRASFAQKLRREIETIEDTELVEAKLLENLVEAKPVRAKPVRAKPVRAKPVRAKPVEAKPVEAKPVEAKPVRAKPVRAKPVGAKPVAIEADSIEDDTLAPEISEQETVLNTVTLPDASKARAP
jgi:hypothetical protein